MKKLDLDIQKIMFPIFRFEGTDFKTRFPPNRSSNLFCIDIKRCLMVMGNYGTNFRLGHIRLGTHTNFRKFPKWKMETLVFYPPLKKSKLFSFFFLPGALIETLPHQQMTGSLSRRQQRDGSADDSPRRGGGGEINPGDGCSEVSLGRTNDSSY